MYERILRGCVINISPYITWLLHIKVLFEKVYRKKLGKFIFRKGVTHIYIYPFLSYVHIHTDRIYNVVYPSVFPLYIWVVYIQRTWTNSLYSTHTYDHINKIWDDIELLKMLLPIHHIQLAGILYICIIPKSITHTKTFTFKKQIPIYILWMCIRYPTLMTQAYHFMRNMII